MINDSFKNYDINTPIRVLEVFNSIDGEQPRMGQTTTFVRLAGCNLSCWYCDTKHSQKFDGGTTTTVRELVDKIANMSPSYNVTITGGEPLLQMDEVDELCHRLNDLNPRYNINIETNGTIKPSLSLLQVVDCMVYDYKSSELFNIIEVLRRQDVVKFVVQNKEELNQVEKMAKQLFYNQVYVGCVQDNNVEITEKDVIDWLLEVGLPNLHFNTQLHKKIGVA